MGFDALWIFDSGGIMLFSYTNPGEIDMLVMGLLEGFSTFARNVFKRSITLINMEDTTLYFHKTPYGDGRHHITVVTKFIDADYPNPDRIADAFKLCKTIGSAFLDRYTQSLKKTTRLYDEFSTFITTCEELIQTTGIV